MKESEQYTVSELLDQFQKEDMELPEFMPKIKIPIIGKIINDKLKASMRISLVKLIIT